MAAHQINSNINTQKHKQKTYLILLVVCTKMNRGELLLFLLVVGIFSIDFFKGRTGSFFDSSSLPPKITQWELDSCTRTVSIQSVAGGIPPYDFYVFKQEEPFSYFSVGLGGVLNWDKLWVGFSGHHLNRPNVTFYVRDGKTQHWPKYSLQVGYTIPLEEPEFWEEGSGKFVHLMANYKRQGPFQFLDAGVQVLLNQLVVGGGFRSLPIQSDLPKRESVIGLVGLNLSAGLAVGYSYDYPISDVGSETLGSHELSFRYQFFYGSSKSRGQRSRVLPCFSYLR